MASESVFETASAVNSTRYLVCPECQQTAPDQLIPRTGKHIHVCPGFESNGQKQGGGYDCYYDGAFLGSRRTHSNAQQLLNGYMFDLLADGLITNPVAQIEPETFARTLDSFDAPDGVTQRTVTVAEFEQAATVLCDRANGRLLRQLADQVIVAHAAQQLQFRYWGGGILDVVSWLTDGEDVEVTPLGDCQACESQTCIHAVLHTMLCIRERGMTTLIRRERHGGYRYELAV